MNEPLVYNRFDFPVERIKFLPDLETNIRDILAANNHVLKDASLNFYGQQDVDNMPAGRMCIEIGPTQGFLNSTQREVLEGYLREALVKSGLKVSPTRVNPNGVWERNLHKEL